MCINVLNNQQIVDLMNSFEDNISNLEIDIIFVDSNYQRIHKFKEYKLLIDGHEAEITPTVKGIFNYIISEIPKRSFETYDLELNIDDTVQIVEKSKVINGDELLSEIDQMITDNNQLLDSSINLKGLNFIVIKIYNPTNEKKLYLFQRYVHPTTKYSNSFKYVLNGKVAKLFNKDLVTINTSVDAILYENNYYILNRQNFNRMFNFKDVFYKIIEDNTEKIEQSNLFVLPDNFIEDCKQDGRYLPRLTKVILAEGFNSVNDNKNKLPELKEQYGLSFNLNEDNRIDYNGKSQITDILNVLLDHFVISALTQKKMLAKAIEKYEV